MANVKVDFSGLRDFAKQLNDIPTDSMCKEAVTQLGAVYIASAKKNTPVGGTKTREVSEGEFKASGATEHDKLKDFNRLKKGSKKDLKVAYKSKGKMKFKIFTSSEHMRRSWQMGNVEKRGRTYRIKVSNSASYATYVDKGHRQTPGRFVPILGKRLVGNYVEGLKITDKAEKAVKRAQNRVFKDVIGKHTKGV